MWVKLEHLAEDAKRIFRANWVLILQLDRRLLLKLIQIAQGLWISDEAQVRLTRRANHFKDHIKHVVPLRYRRPILILLKVVAW